MIGFGELAPDQPSSVLGISRYIYNAVPIADANSGVSYGPWASLQTPAGASAAGESPKGVISLVNSSGTYQVYIGQSTTIEQVNSSWGLTDIDTGLSLTTDDDWSFAHRGAFLVATNTTEGMWNYNVDSASGAGAVSDGPAARQIAVLEETILAFDCDGDNKRWQNCALGDHTNWSTLEANGDTLEDGGALIKGLNIGNGNMVVLQSDAVRLFSIGGGASLINVHRIADGVGSVGERSAVQFNGVCYWLAQQGFMMSNGAGITPIGDGRIDATFADIVSGSDTVNVRAAVAPEHKLVIWNYDGHNYCYNWALNRWGYFYQAVNALVSVATPGIDMDSAAAYGNVDTVPYGPDSRFWKGGAPTLGAFGTDNKVAFFSGSNMAATLDTAVANYELSTRIDSATPITDDSAVTLAVGVSETLDTTPTFSTDISRQASGRVPLRGRGKNITFRQKHAAAANWSFARGIDHVEASSGGRR